MDSASNLTLFLKVSTVAELNELIQRLEAMSDDELIPIIDKLRVLAQ